MVVIEIDGKERKDYEIKELLIIGKEIKIALRKKSIREELNNFNTGSYQRQNNPVLEIKNNNQPNPSQILCGMQASQGQV